MVWDPTVCLLDHFTTKQQGYESLAAVGLNKAVYGSLFSMLSHGEQEQANVARLLGHHDVVIDEFTSSLDRDTVRYT